MPPRGLLLRWQFCHDAARFDNRIFHRRDPKYTFMVVHDRNVDHLCRGVGNLSVCIAAFLGGRRGGDPGATWVSATFLSSSSSSTCIIPSTSFDSLPSSNIDAWPYAISTRNGLSNSSASSTASESSTAAWSLYGDGRPSFDIVSSSISRAPAQGSKSLTNCEPRKSWRLPRSC